MYEEYYGFAQPPFSLTPDPRFLYRSEAHQRAFDVLVNGIRRREGFLVVIGDIGTGKTTLSRAVIEALDRRTFTAVVLNPFLSDEDLLRVMLRDFGIVSREEIRHGRFSQASRQALIDALNEFLLSLAQLDANAVVFIDEAQNLPLQTLEQIRMLSNLEANDAKLLQVVLVGQRELEALLQAPELRQLEQRISRRVRLGPLPAEEVEAYVAYRLWVARGTGAVHFPGAAVGLVHRLSGGVPRVINLLCDRTLEAAAEARARLITPELVVQAARTLDIPIRLPIRIRAASRRLRRRAAVPLLIGAGVLTAAAVSYVLAPQLPTLLDELGLGPNGGREASRQVPEPSAAIAPPPPAAPALPPAPPGRAEMPPAPAREPSGTPEAVETARYSVVVASFLDSARADAQVAELAQLGYEAHRVQVGRWLQVRVGRLPDPVEARQLADRLRQLPQFPDATIVTEAAAP